MRGRWPEAIFVIKFLEGRFMNRLFLYIAFGFLFLTFADMGISRRETPLLGLTLAMAGEGAKSIQTTNTEPCKPTPPDALGPFYTPNAPERTSVGKGHILSGVVRTSVDCSPIAGARIECWLTGPDGKYDDDHRATMFADKEGAYKFESNFPPPYSGRPSHIHMKITAKGFRTLVTQYYPDMGKTEGEFDLVLIPVD
ncbi:MAG: intradiol ring-cleavage dioxygenase [Candidatus Brocadia sp. AMX2]|nr:MAG: intradiol ring-cleavage dioxygenase [Candidatus Brocadia sp. AMX2]MBC6931420.1 intradiol ring-cleavage dioxygenase [Candidatus Brocadia sp.]MBL1167524.1 intradiol ring-cleavage dioxygenase [Candidatus Brocadia sp. AMX1]MCE7867703.1 intradiol ring-cleavage dioxygenase [Candidatus Brocadia sp. AMX2]MCQ3916521.1 intradiol ring-cleavage dioxygenase [Candidatus Brocadia sp.]